MCKIVAVCISKDDLSKNWQSDIPLVCYTDGFQDFPHFPRLKTRFRIDYLAKRRNAANEAALKQHPDLTHFLQIDSYYIQDAKTVKELVTEYLHAMPNVILGASTWYVDPSRIRKRYWYWDSWTNPEFAKLNVKDAPQGWVQTRGAGGIAIYPRWVWEKQRYGVPEPFPESGCESNYLSRCPDTRTFITFNVKAWRDPPEELMNKPWINRLRTSLGLGTKMRRLGIPDILWILHYRVLSEHNYDWLKGHYWQDGFRWNTRGVSDSFMAFRGHESWLTDEILRPGKLFVDVGAHVGTWSIRASKFYKSVMAFEPSPSTRKVLEKNILDNEIGNIMVYPCAVGETRKKGVMHHFSRLDGGNTLLETHPLLNGKPKPVADVNVESLDSFDFTPSLIKIDTEGYELPVLKGAKETLARTERVIVEIHGDKDVLPVRDLLDGHGFKTRLIVSQNEVHVIGDRILS